MSKTVVPLLRWRGGRRSAGSWSWACRASTQRAQRCGRDGWLVSSVAWIRRPSPTDWSQFAGAARRFEARGQVGTRRAVDTRITRPKVEAAIQQESRRRGQGGGHRCLSSRISTRAHILRTFRHRTVRHETTAGDPHGAREDPTRRRFDVDLLPRAQCYLHVEDMQGCAPRGVLTPEGGVCVVNH